MSGVYGSITFGIGRIVVSRDLLPALQILRPHDLRDVLYGDVELVLVDLFLYFRSCQVLVRPDGSVISPAFLV